MNLSIIISILTILLVCLGFYYLWRNQHRINERCQNLLAQVEHKWSLMDSIFPLHSKEKRGEEFFNDNDINYDARSNVNLCRIGSGSVNQSVPTPAPPETVEVEEDLEEEEEEEEEPPHDIDEAEAEEVKDDLEETDIDDAHEAEAEEDLAEEPPQDLDEAAEEDYAEEDYAEEDAEVGEENPQEVVVEDLAEELLHDIDNVEETKEKEDDGPSDTYESTLENTSSIQCSCGGSYIRGGRSRHEKSKRHISAQTHMK